MEIPKFHETFAPILNTLKHKGTLSRSDLKQEIINRYYSALTEAQLNEKTSTGELLVANRIGYGLMYLKQAKFIEQPERAMFSITEKGIKALLNNALSVREIRKDKDYVAHADGICTPEKNIGSSDSIISENASPQDLIDSGIEQFEAETKATLIQKLREVNPYIFEIIVTKLFEAMGYGEATVTKKSGDGGIDGVINHDKLGLEKIYIQSKRYAEGNVIGSPEINAFVGAIKHGVRMGIFVTTSSFSKAAREAIVDTGKVIKLIDGRELADLMYHYGVGVQVKKTYSVKEMDEDFFEEN